MKFFSLILTIFVVSNFCFGQTKCNCESNFEWTRQTFEKNDAGFQYIIDQKGKEAYEAHNRMILGRVKNAKTTAECSTILYDWMKFFRKGHIGIKLLNSQQQTQTPIITDSNTVAKHEVLRVDEKAFQKRVDANLF